MQAKKMLSRLRLASVQFLLIALINSFVTGCSSPARDAPVSENKPGTIKRDPVVEVQTGMVTAVKNVLVLGKRSGVGSTVGRTVGSIAGGAVGSGYGSVAGSILGSVLGGAAGSSADKELQRKPGVEIEVRLDNGEYVTVTQLADKKESFRQGDHVKLVMKDGQAHVTHR